MTADKIFEFPDGTKDAALGAVAALRTNVLRRTQQGKSPRWLAELLFHDLDTAMRDEVAPVARSRFDLNETRYTEFKGRRNDERDDDNAIWERAVKNVDEAIRAVAVKLSEANSDPISEAARGRPQAGLGSATVKLRTGDGRWALRVSGPLHAVEADDKSANIYLLPEIIDRSAQSVEASSASSAMAERDHEASKTRRLLHAWSGWALRSTRRAAAFLISLLAAAACIWALVSSLNQPKPSETRLDLSTTGQIHLGYGGLQEDGISPVCGCPNEVDPNEWWGISGLARNVGLERIGGGPYTKYLLFGPGPSEIRFAPDVFQTSARIFIVKHPSGTKDSMLVCCSRESFQRVIKLRRWRT